MGEREGNKSRESQINKISSQVKNESKIEVDIQSNKSEESSDD